MQFCQSYREQHALLSYHRADRCFTRPAFESFWIQDFQAYERFVQIERSQARSELQVDCKVCQQVVAINHVIVGINSIPIIMRSFIEVAAE